MPRAPAGQGVTTVMYDSRIIYGEEHARDGCAGAAVVFGIIVLFVGFLVLLFGWQLLHMGVL